MDVIWKNIGSLDNIPARGARRLRFDYDGRPIAVFRTSEGRVFALVDGCPHRQGPLSEGIVSGDTVTCPLHNWVIDLRSGAALAPDEGCVVTLPVRIAGGEVHIGLPRAMEKSEGMPCRAHSTA